MLFGATFVGPIGHYHFVFLEKSARFFFTSQTALKNAWIYKLFMAQFVYWSWLNNGSYITFMSLLNGKSLTAAKEEFCSRIMDIQKKNWIFWLPAASICFKCVPVPLQLTYTLGMNVFWSSFLSWYNNSLGHCNTIPAVEDVKTYYVASEMTQLTRLT